MASQKYYIKLLQICQLLKIVFIFFLSFFFWNKLYKLFFLSLLFKLMKKKILLKIILKIILVFSNQPLEVGAGRQHFC